MRVSQVALVSLLSGLGLETVVRWPLKRLQSKVNKLVHLVDPGESLEADTPVNQALLDAILDANSRGEDVIVEESTSAEMSVFAADVERLNRAYRDVDGVHIA